MATGDSVHGSVTVVQASVQFIGITCVVICTELELGGGALVVIKVVALEADGARESVGALEAEGTLLTDSVLEADG